MAKDIRTAGAAECMKRPCLVNERQKREGEINRDALQKLVGEDIKQVY